MLKPVILYGLETSSFYLKKGIKLFENGALKRMFCSERKEVTE
jgi:hypothetical protein